MSRIQLLKWDSDFFGFGVGKLSESVVPRGLEEVAAALEYHDVAVLYWITTSVPGGGFKAYHVLDQTTLTKTLINRSGRARLPDGYWIGKYTPAKASEELFELAIVAGWSSRFRVDPRFGESRFREMYRIWIDRSCSREIADAVLVVRHGNSIAGMVTLAADETDCRIGLIAVSPQHQRRGLATVLMQAAEEYAVSQGCSSMSVVTQSVNQNARALYEAAGFAETRTAGCFHFWRESVG